MLCLLWLMFVYLVYEIAISIWISLNYLLTTFRWERSMSLPLDSDTSEDSLSDSKIGRRMDLALCKSSNYFSSFIVDSIFICWLFYIGTAADDIRKVLTLVLVRFVNCLKWWRFVRRFNWSNVLVYVTITIIISVIYKLSKAIQGTSSMYKYFLIISQVTRTTNIF